MKRWEVSQTKRHIPVRIRKKWTRRVRERVATTTESISVQQNPSSSQTPPQAAKGATYGTASTPRIPRNLQTRTQNEPDHIPKDVFVADQSFEADEALESSRHQHLCPSVSLRGVSTRNGDGSVSGDDSEEEDIHNIYVGDECYAFTSDINLDTRDSEDHDASQVNCSPTKALEQVMLHEHVLSGLCLVVGRSRLTFRKYSEVRSFINHEGIYGRREGYPSYTKLYSTTLPLMRTYVYVLTTRRTFDVDSRRSWTAQPPRVNAPGDLAVARKDIKVIAPSSWARKNIYRPRLCSLQHRGPMQFRNVTVQPFAMQELNTLLFCANVHSTSGRTSCNPCQGMGMSSSMRTFRHKYENQRSLILIFMTERE